MNLRTTPSDRLLITATFAQADPMRLFSYFVEPTLLARWWAPKAAVDAQRGGRYHLQWPAMNWHLRGEYQRYSPGKALVFTWRWDHEPQMPTRTVTIEFAPYGDGSRLTLEQGTYGQATTEQDDRRSHAEGWLHFLGVLQDVTRA